MASYLMPCYLPPVPPRGVSSPHFYLFCIHMRVSVIMRADISSSSLCVILQVELLSDIYTETNCMFVIGHLHEAVELILNHINHMFSAQTHQERKCMEYHAVYVCATRGQLIHSHPHSKETLVVHINLLLPISENQGIFPGEMMERMNDDEFSGDVLINYWTDVFSSDLFLYIRR